MENNIPPNPDFAKIKSEYFHFVKEFRKKLIFTLIIFVIATFTGFIFYEKIIAFLIDLLSLEGINIVFTSPFQFINLSISCGVAIGLITVFPILVAQILSFSKPALKRNEFKMVTRFLPYCLILFLIGFALGAYIMKWQIEIFLVRASALGIGNVLDISRLLSTILLTSTFMGVGFQFPIILILLMRLRIISPQQLGKKRSWIYLGSFIFAILLPVDSVLADIFLSLPLILLFEVTLLIGYLYEKKRVKATEEIVSR